MLRSMALCQMFLACRHCRWLSTQVLRVSTRGSGTPSRVPSAVRVCAQNRSSLAWPPNVMPSSYSGSLARISTCARMTVASPARSAENVIHPANICPCGVIRVNDSWSAYSTNTPVDSLTPPPIARSSSATSPGLIPASAPAKRFPFGQNSGEVRLPGRDRVLRGDDLARVQAVALLPHLAEALDRAGQPAARHVRAAHAVALLHRQALDLGGPVARIAALDGRPGLPGAQPDLLGAGHPLRRHLSCRGRAFRHCLLTHGPLTSPRRP